MHAVPLSSQKNAEFTTFLPFSQHAQPFFSLLAQFAESACKQRAMCIDVVECLAAPYKEEKPALNA